MALFKIVLVVVLGFYLNTIDSSISNALHLSIFGKKAVVLLAKGRVRDALLLRAMYHENCPMNSPPGYPRINHGMGGRAAVARACADLTQACTRPQLQHSAPEGKPKARPGALIIGIKNVHAFQGEAVIGELHDFALRQRPGRAF